MCAYSLVCFDSRRRAGECCVVSCRLTFRRVAFCDDGRNYDGARRILRDGSLAKLRTDLQVTEKFLDKRIILRDVALTLDAFDDALRAESIQNVAASSEDVRRTADELVVKLKDVRDAIDEATSAPSVRGQ